MNGLAKTALAFVEMAHRIVWCSAAAADTRGRPRSRILHPIWQWNGGELVGWVATGPTPVKLAHLEANPYMSMSYWSPTHDTCVADCRVEWAFDEGTRRMVWDLFVSTPPPVGYDPSIIPGWEDYDSEGFAALRLEPWRLRVFPGSVLMGEGGEILNWRE